MLKVIGVAAISVAVPAAGLAAGSPPVSVAPSTQQGNSSVRKGSAMNTMPASPLQIWERVLQLLSEDKGFTPKDRVEEVLGIRFTHAEKEGELRNLGAANFYSLKVESPELGEFKVGLFDDPRRTGMSIEWGQERRDTPHCLDLKGVTRELHDQGWVSLPRATNPGSRQLQFVRPDELAESRKRRDGLDIGKGYSALFLLSPNHLSQCVNGFSSTVWRESPI